MATPDRSLLNEADLGRDIVVLGGGHQARRHLACFAKLRVEHGVRIAAVVDPSEERRRACRAVLAESGFDPEASRFVADIEQLGATLDLGSAVVDVVAPTRLHYPLAAAATRMGARQLIVEKPLAHDLEEANRFLELSGTVHVLENYLFSGVTATMRECLRRVGCRPCFMRTEFSKDRRLDSSRGRGMSPGYVPHVFSVEIPHQIAVANLVLGSVGEAVDAWAHDMVLSDGTLAGHGEGAITLLHEGGIASYNFSCLQGFRHMSLTHRSATVYCADAVRIHGRFACTADLRATVEVFERERRIASHVLTDDSLTWTLGGSLTAFRRQQPAANDVHFGIEVLRIIDRGRRIAAEAH